MCIWFCRTLCALTVSFLVLKTGIATVVIRTGPWPSSSWLQWKIAVEREREKEEEKEGGRRGMLMMKHYTKEMQLHGTLYGIVHIIWIILLSDIRWMIICCITLVPEVVNLTGILQHIESNYLLESLTKLPWHVLFMFIICLKMCSITACLWSLAE